MQCNIDAKGKRARLLSGLVTIVAALVVFGLALGGVWADPWAWLVGGLLLAIGGFQVFEGWAGWCVMRAMGFKTPV